MTDIEQVLTFQLQDNQYYAIDALCVVEIIYKPNLNEIPGTDASTKALTTFRNRTTFVQNMDTLINNNTLSPTLEEDNFIIVINNDEDHLGVGVKKVDDIIHLNDKKIFPSSDFMSDQNLISGAFENNNKTLIQIINNKQLFSIIDIEPVF